MNVKPGQILPVNYQFWPAGSENIVQAMVMRQIGDFYELCPVHANIDSAGFFDLIVSGKTIKSEMDLVVMCRDSARFPALALNTLQQDEDYDMGPILTEEEGQRILKDKEIILSHQDTKMAYSVLRGTALPANCDEKIWADDLRLEWQVFRLAAMCEAVKIRQSDMPGYLSIASVLEWAGKLVSNFLKPLAENDLADMITPAYASGANVKKKKQAKEEDHLDSLRQKLNKDLAENDSGNKELQELVNKDDPADLLEAVLRIYPEREI